MAADYKRLVKEVAGSFKEPFTAKEVISRIIDLGYRMVPTNSFVCHELAMNKEYEIVGRYSVHTGCGYVHRINLYSRRDRA